MSPLPSLNFRLSLVCDMTNAFLFLQNTRTSFFSLLSALSYSSCLTLPAFRFPHTFLLVGCCGDAVTHAYKGKTVMTQEERYESLRHCRWVDEVVEDAPWVISPHFLAAHQIHYVAHDDLPYADRQTPMPGRECGCRVGCD